MYLEDYQAGKLLINNDNTICTAQSQSAVLTAKITTTVPTAEFYPCLETWMKTDKGRYFAEDIRFNASRKIVGYRQKVSPIAITIAATEGPEYLEDIKALTSKYGFDDTYSFSMELLDYEQFVVLLQETFTSVGLSVAAVFLVVIFVTGSVPVTLLVVLAVVLVDVFLLGLVYFWDLTMNSIVTVILVVGLGLAVDYSAHIAHTYLIVEAP